MTQSPVDRTRVRRSNTRRKWALRVMGLCRGKRLDVNSPDAVKAAGILGFEQAMAIYTGATELRFTTRRGQDAMLRRVPGSYGSRQ